MKTNFTTLIEPGELCEILDEDRTVVLDVRFSLADPQLGKNEYDKGHVDGAYYLSLDDDLSSEPTTTSGRHPLPLAETLVGKLRRCGLTNASQVVAYDDAGGAIAGRMWWLLKWLGHANVAVLNGGLPNWIRHGFDVTSVVPPPQDGTFEYDIQEHLAISTQEVESGLQDDSIRLVDARAANRFAGKHEPIDPVAGHIPGAVNAPFKNNLNDDGCFYPPDELSGIHLKGDNVVCMCGSGVTACHNILASAIVHNDMPRLYVGSWSEWIRDPQHPVGKE